jgi:general secretion pathway protein G
MSIYQQPVEIPWNINASPLTTMARRPLSTTRKTGRPIFAQATINGARTVSQSIPGHRQPFGGGVGVTLIELIIAMAILSILMSGILPLSYMAYKRSREIELRQNLRIVRTALDEYKKKVDEGRIPKENDDSGYPPELAVLVAGVESADAVPVIFKFLRRIPRDPMTEDGEWGLRAYADEPDSNIWGGQDVYDVYSQSDEQALDGTYYRDW